MDDLTNESGGARTAEVQVSIDERENVSIVIAAGEDAVWVEFGAGVYHNGSAGSSPHPKGSELGFTIGGYGKGMGKRQTWGSMKRRTTPDTWYSCHYAYVQCGENRL